MSDEMQQIYSKLVEQVISSKSSLSLYLRILIHECASDLLHTHRDLGKLSTVLSARSYRLQSMDQLQIYSSDSEGGGDDKDEDDQASTRTSFEGNKSVDKHCFPSESGQADTSVGSSSLNFLGIISDPSQESFGDEEDNKERDLSTFVQVHGEFVEVPQSDFWRDFSEAEISADIEGGNAKSTKRKFEGPVHQHGCGILSSNHSKAKRCRENGKSACMGTNHGAESDENHVSLSGHMDLRGETNKTSLLQNGLSLKVFSVHPKISPHLHRQQSNWCVSKESHRWAGHAGVINKIAWCSAPSFSHLILSASMDSTVRVWNAWGQHEVCVRTLTTHTKAVRDAQWSEDGRQVLSCSYDRTAAITDVQTGQSSVQIEHSGFVSAGKFHPVTPHLVATGATDCIQVWDIRQSAVPVRMLTHKEQLGQIQDLMFTHDGRELFSSGDVVTRESSDRTILAWDFRTGVILSNQIFQERYTVTRLCLHPSHSQFLAQTQAGYIAVFSTQRPYKMNKNKRLEGHKAEGYKIGLSISPDGSLVYSGSSDGKLHCYNFNNGKRIRTLTCGGVLLDVAAHPVLPSVVAGATWNGDIVCFQ